MSGDERARGEGDGIPGRGKDLGFLSCLTLWWTSSTFAQVSLQLWMKWERRLESKTICFSCSNEEQCLTDKGASSLLLCCLWLELDAGKNGNSQCECFFSRLTGYGWACTLYIADGTIANTVRTRKEWITAFSPPLASQENQEFLHNDFYVCFCVDGAFLSNIRY